LKRNGGNFQPLKSAALFLTIKIKKLKTIIVIGLIVLSSTFAKAQENSGRNTISLNGNWQIAEGTNDAIPADYDHTVVVPGLVSLAVPAFRNVGPKVEDRQSVSQCDP